MSCRWVRDASKNSCSDGVAPGWAHAQAGACDVIQRFPGPLEGTHHILFVEPRLLEEVPILALDEPGELDGKHELDAEPRVLQELVIEEGPDEGPHAIGGAVDEVRFVNPIEQHDDARKAECLQQSLELGQQLVAIVGAQAVRQRLAGEFPTGELHQRVSQFMSFPHADPHPAKNAALGARLDPSARRGAPRRRGRRAPRPTNSRPIGSPP